MILFILFSPFLLPIRGSFTQFLSGFMMNRHKFIVLIVLLMTMPPSSILAAELIIYSSGEVRTLVLQSSEPSSAAQDKGEATGHFKYDHYRKVEEKCVRGCDEEKVITKAPAGLPK